MRGESRVGDDAVSGKTSQRFSESASQRVGDDAGSGKWDDAGSINMRLGAVV